MKSILLTSTALVAFAGAAAADGHAETGIVFTGEATLGYNTNEDINDSVPAAAGLDGIVGNDDDVTQPSEGFFWDASVDVTMTSVLDNGLVAEATFGLNVSDNSLGTDGANGDFLNTSDYVISLTGESASLTFGNTDPVAESRFGDVDGGTTDGFNDQDEHFDDLGFEAILVGEATFGGFTGAVSFGIDSGDGTAVGVDDVDALQLHIAGTVSILDIELAYQDEVASADSVFGIAASASVAGADLTVSYVDDGTENSTGLAVAYPLGPVTATASYSINDIAEDNYALELNYASNGIDATAKVEVDGDGGADGGDLVKYNVEGSYDVGNGLTVFAGFLGDDADDSDTTYYIAGEYDLGGGAEILVSFADDGNEAAVGEDLGDPDYKEGATVQVTFEF